MQLAFRAFTKCENRLAARKNDSVRESFSRICMCGIRLTSSESSRNVHLGLHFVVLASFGIGSTCATYRPAQKVACWLGNACHIAWIRAPRWV